MALVELGRIRELTTTLGVPDDLFSRDMRIGKISDKTKEAVGYDFEDFKTKYLDRSIEEIESARGINFDDKEIEWLNTFALFSYRIDNLISDGENAHTLARLALAYELAECYFYHEAQCDITDLPDDEILNLLDKDFSGELPESLDFLGETLELATPSMDLREYYQEMIRDIHSARKLVTEGSDFSQITAKDPYFTAAVPIYVVSKNMTYRVHNETAQAKGVEGTTKKELSNMAKAMMIAEQPSIFHNPNYLKFRKQWSRMAIIAQDYWTREVAHPAYAIGNWLLDETSSSHSFAERWEKAMSLKPGEFFQDGESPNNTFCFDSSPKGVMSILQKLLKDKDIFELMNHIQSTSEASPLSRIQTLASIVDNYFTGNATQNTEKLRELIGLIRDRAKKVDDILRIRLVVTDGSLDETTRATLTGNPDSYVSLIRGPKDNSERERHTVASLVEEGKSIEQVINEWNRQSIEKGVMSNFGAVFVKRQINGVPCEMQIMTVSQAENNWKSRAVYHSIVQSQ